MEEAITGLLLADAGLSALVGTRINWNVRPQGSVLPAVVLQTVSAVPEYADEGEVAMFESRVQADCWAATYASAKAVARAVKSVLSGITATVGDLELTGAWIDREEDLYDTGAGETPLHRVSLDFLITHSLP